MVVGETFLKFTDYPFAYTLVIIIAKVAGFSITQNQFLIFGIAGAFGTFLTIADWPGGAVKKSIEKRFKNREKKDDVYDENLYAISSINTRSIGVEIDKIGGLIYFVISALVFMVSVASSTTFAGSLVIVGNDGNTLCDTFCIQVTTGVSSAALMGYLGLVAGNRWKELDEKCLIAGFHKFAINNEYAISNSVENMTRAVEQNDWEIAKDWREKIKEEIKLKKSKRDLIIKTVETIFRPLHIESRNIENTLRQFPINRDYSDLPRGEWDKIISESTNMLIDDAELRKEISDFYQKINEYNTLYRAVVNNIRNIVNSNVGSAYSKQRVTEVRIDLRNDQNVTTGYPLLNCAMFNVHPTSLLNNSRIQSIVLTLRDDNNNTRTEGLGHHQEIAQFSLVWDQIIGKIQTNELYTRLQHLISEIDSENKKLRQKYQEKIEMQRKV